MAVFKSPMLLTHVALHAEGLQLFFHMRERGQSLSSNHYSSTYTHLKKQPTNVLLGFVTLLPTNTQLHTEGTVKIEISQILQEPFLNLNITSCFHEVSPETDSQTETRERLK